MSEFVEMALASVELSPEWQAPATGTIRLVEMLGDQRTLEIVMARPDALLIQEAIGDKPPPRPRTHDLFVATIEEIGGALIEVAIVDRLPGGVYPARLTVRGPDGESRHVDCRPSDALNLALRTAACRLTALETLLGIPEN